MRPLRLMMEGFGSYRERTELDFADVSFFVLTGPTGAGKSTVIDGLCFALYGTVPRWGKGNVIRNALAPSTAQCRVVLVFEAAGGRYAAARVLRRDARGNVHTKEARLDRLNDAVAVDAELEQLLEDVVESQTEGPDQVTSAVAELLGIGYEHFTQCVLLPQGRFAEFLHAKPSDRQDLLIELLAYAVYEQVGQRVRERANVAKVEHATAARRLEALGAVTDDDLAAASTRVEAFDALAPRVEEAVEAIGALRERWTEANRLATEAREQVTGLAALAMPAGAAELASSLVAADEVVGVAQERSDQADRAETVAERACAALPPADELRRWLDGYTRDTTLRADLGLHQQRLTTVTADVEARTAEHEAAETAVAQAESALAAAEQAHRAAALATDLVAGDPCPVCFQPVGELPHHDVPADLGAARTAVKDAKSAVAASRRRLDSASNELAAARNTCELTEKHLAEVRAGLAAAPPEADVRADLTARADADAALTAARTAARTARSALTEARRRRESLHSAEGGAWSALRSARDRFAALKAPPVDGLDLATAWQTLLDWASATHAELASTADGLETKVEALRQEGADASRALRDLLAEHGIEAPTERAAQQAPAVLAAAREGARRDLASLNERRDEAVALAADVARLKDEHAVAAQLGLLLKSDGFERWLCASALDSLVIEASETLMQLSGGQYELDRGDRNELFVIDHNDAGTRRPVNTLSGGETFQASLSLALALSRQVVGLSAGRRSLDSMFLDEGFGTLDESTLDTVAATLEQLAGDSERVVGVVTHVPALAERIPVQFAVTRNGASSSVRRL